MTEPAGRKVLHVPSGLAGERVDAALARLFGLSRTKAAELVAAGDVRVDGNPRPSPIGWRRAPSSR